MAKAELLDRLQTLLDAATPGEWTLSKHGGAIRGGALVEFVNGSAQTQIALATNVHEQNTGSQEANAALIVAMKSALPELLAMAREHEAKRVSLDRGREERRLNAQREAERERDDLRKQLAVEVAVNADYPDVVADRDRYLAALKAEACRVERDHVSDYGDYTHGKVAWKIGGIGFAVTRKPDGTLEATEVE